MHRSRVIEDQISLSQSHLPMWYAKGLRVDSNIHLIPNVPRNSEEPPHQHLQLIICQWCVSLQSDENDFVYQVISSPFQVASCNCLTNSEAPWLCSLTESPTPKCRVMLHCVGSRPYMRRTHIGLDVLFDSTRVSGLFRVSVPWKKHLQHYSTIPSPAKPKGMWKSVLSLWRPLEPQVVKADCIAIVFRHRKKQQQKCWHNGTIRHANVSWDSQNWWEIHGNSKSPIEILGTSPHDQDHPQHLHPLKLPGQGLLPRLACVVNKPN